MLLISTVPLHQAWLKQLRSSQSLIGDTTVCCCLLQHGSPDAVMKVEQRRQQIPAAGSSTDHLHTLLLKHRDGELWPVQSVEKDHIKRLLGLLPPFPQPAAPILRTSHPAAQGPQNGHSPNLAASPMMDTW